MSAEIRLFRPPTLESALALLADFEGDRPVILAGGTDLMRQIGRGAIRPSVVVDISRIGELQGVSPLADGGLRIGALTSFRRLGTDPLVAARAPLLAEAARGLGAAQTQARATLGGNLARGSPASDSPPVLIAQGGEALLLSRDGGERRSPLESLFTPRGTDIGGGELIASVTLEPLPPGADLLYRKVAARRAQAVAKVLLAGVGRIDAAGRIDHLRLAAGAVGPAALRLLRAEAAALGRRPSECAKEAADAAAREIDPIDDVRSTADYRRQVLKRLVTGFVAGLDAAGTGQSGTDRDLEGSGLTTNPGRR